MSATEKEQEGGGVEAAQEERERPVLRLRKTWIPEGGKTCPGCGEGVTGDAVVCHRCGWNFTTGKKTRGVEGTIRRERFLKRAFGWGMVVAIAVAAGVAVHWALGHRGEVERWVAAGAEKASELADIGKENVREIRERERLDRELPMWGVGDEVTLEKTNGAILKGTLVGTGDGVVTVETADGPQTVGLVRLSGRSRARVDGLYREELIRKRAGGF